MNDYDYKPFATLKKQKKKLKLKDENPVKKKPKAELKPDPVIEEAMDNALFMRAMTGTTRLETSGRVTKQKAATPQKPVAKPATSAPSAPPAPKKAPAKTKKQPAPTMEPAPAEDENVFLNAMSGVKPMDGNTGRSVPKRIETPEVKPGASEDALSREHLEQLIRGDVNFEVEYTEEYQHGQVSGLDPKIFNKLKAGSYSVEAHLDLHGQTTDTAIYEVVDFVRKHYKLGHRNLLIVTGRGIGSPMGRSVIREELQHWLTKEPLRRVVLAFVTAQPCDGGPGAVYVLLRKFKKSIGKIKWDRLPGDWDNM